MFDSRILKYIFLIFGFCILSIPAHGEKVNIFAAASLVDILQTLADDYQSQKLQKDEIVIIAGSSSILARQIIAGAPADIFISADFYNADKIAKEIELKPKEVFGNSLIIIAPIDYKGNLSLQDLPKAIGISRLAIGDPSHVPAGIYAKEAMVRGGVWKDLKDNLAPAGNVRAASAFVARGASPFGIVYATEAKYNGLRIASYIDDDLYSPIIYWGLVIEENNKTANDFFSYISSKKAQKILQAHGFRVKK